MEIEYTRNGRRRTVNAHVGKVLIKRGLARDVDADAAPARKAAETYQTRMLSAAPAPAVDLEAPYGYKADGTPRKRPAPVRKAAEAD